MQRFFLKYQIIAILFFLPVISFAQTDSLQNEDILNEILNDQIEDSEDESVTDAVEFLLNNPININKADINELQKIPYVDFATAKIIIDHRNRYGAFFSTNELYSINAIPKESMSRIIPFLTVENPEGKEDISHQNVYPETSPLTNLKIILRSRMLNDLQDRKGFKTNKFNGSSHKIYNRIIARYDYNFQAGAVIEKDAGEASFADYQSFHIAAKEIGILKSLVLGDFSIEFGQGLALWSAYGFSKSSDAVYPVKKKAAGIKPYTSTDENNFFRGGAAGFELNNLSVFLFYSNNKFDANIDSAAGIILSRPIDGLHRNQNELLKKNSAREKIYGAAINYSFLNSISAGFVYYNSSFTNPFMKDEVFDLDGNEFSYSSLFYDVVSGPFNFFGEFAFNLSDNKIKTPASINGVQISFSRDFIFAASIRNYPWNYTNLHGQGFGEQSGKTENEFGIYTGFKWRMPLGIFNFYYDQFKFPFSTFDNPLPSTGDEFLLSLSSKPIYKFETKLYFKYERKDVSINSEKNKISVKRNRQNSRIELIFELSKSIRLKGRFDYNVYRVDDANTLEDGILFYQEIKYAPVSVLNLYARVIFFNTDSFNSAVYEYENDLTGVLSNFAMYGEGMRWYLVLRWKPIKILSLSFKYSETYKPREKFLSSGDSQIDGNLDNRIGLQLDFNF